MWPRPEPACSPPSYRHTELGGCRGSALQMGCVRRSTVYGVKWGAPRAGGTAGLFECGHGTP
eukprot:scaffold326747_cov90-Tisochrysis_lutea.AAC.1